MTYPKIRFAAFVLSTCGSLACADDVGSDDGPGSSEGSTGSSSESVDDGTTTAETSSSGGSSETTLDPTSESSSDGTSSSSGAGSSEDTSSSGGSSSSESSAGESSSGDDFPPTSASGSESSSDDGGPVCACLPGEYCDWSDDMCGDGLDGVCVAVPVACDDILEPVCGCDGEDYANDCEAAALGIDVAYEGMCSLDTCDCVGGEYCELPVGQCDGEDGVCEEMPFACGEIYAPVCGCNGVTYSNECEAAGAGVNVEYDGVC